MSAHHGLLMATATALACLAGCSGDGPASAPPPSDQAQTLAIGPMLVRPASTAGFTTTALDNPNSVCSFVGLHGAQINYLASQAVLDRIVFASDRDGYRDIWACNLDGSGATQITNNGALEHSPEWSPDGTHIAFVRQWPSQDPEIMTMNVDGTNVHARTSGTDDEGSPTWSPDGRAIAYHSNPGANFDIFRMYYDGSGATNLTSAPGVDAYPDWSSVMSSQKIVFTSTRDGGLAEVYTMDADGGSPTRLTDDSFSDYSPAWNPGGAMIAWDSVRASGLEVMVMQASGINQRPASNDPDDDQRPAWSSDGRYLAFDSDRAGNLDIWLQETGAPFRAYRVTTHAAEDLMPHLGNPALQVERVLIGPNGSDWGGYDPVWSTAYAGIVAFDGHGYRNFVRIGVRSADVGSIDMTALPDTGWELSGVVVEATEIVNLREDAGRGSPPVVWDLDPLNAGSVVLYFDVGTGRLVSALAVRDVAWPAGRSARACAHSVEGGRLVVTGDFSAVFDAHGRNLAPAGAARVALDGDGGAITVQ